SSRRVGTVSLPSPGFVGEEGKRELPPSGRRPTRRGEGLFMSSVRVVGLLTVLLTGSPAVAQPMSDPAARVRTDKDLETFRRIRDDAPFPWTVTGEKTADRIDDDRMEELAYDEVLRHARQFTTAELEQAARRDVSRADLVVPARLSYKFELVYL